MSRPCWTGTLSKPPPSPTHSWTSSYLHFRTGVTTYGRERNDRKLRKERKGRRQETPTGQR